MAAYWGSLAHAGDPNYAADGVPWPRSPAVLGLAFRVRQQIKTLRENAAPLALAVSVAVPGGLRFSAFSFASAADSELSTFLEPQRRWEAATSIQAAWRSSTQRAAFRRVVREHRASVRIQAACRGRASPSRPRRLIRCPRTTRTACASTTRTSRTTRPTQSDASTGACAAGRSRRVRSDVASDGGAVVGAGATVLGNLGPGSLLEPGASVPATELWSGAPAAKVRALDARDLEQATAARTLAAEAAATHRDECAKDYATLLKEDAAWEDSEARHPKYFKPVAEDALDEMTQVGGMDTGVVPGRILNSKIHAADGAAPHGDATRH